MVAQVVSRRSQLCCVPSPHVTNKGANQRSKDEKRQHEHGAMNELKLTVNTAAPWGDEAAAGPRAERGRPTWPMEQEHVTRLYSKNRGAFFILLGGHSLPKPHPHTAPRGVCIPWRFWRRGCQCWRQAASMSSNPLALAPAASAMDESLVSTDYDAATPAGDLPSRSLSQCVVFEEVGEAHRELRDLQALDAPQPPKLILLGYLTKTEDGSGSAAGSGPAAGPAAGSAESVAGADGGGVSRADGGGDAAAEDALLVPNPPPPSAPVQTTLGPWVRLELAEWSIGASNPPPPHPLIP